jgi:tetratricopeptide (TPR) repeat protein
MRTVFITWIGVLLLSPPMRAQSAVQNRSIAELAHVSTDARIKAFERLLQSSPHDPRIQSALVSAYLQKVRESADSAYLDRASKLVDRMLERDGGSLYALRFQNEIDLQRHDFRSVAERARDIVRYEPSDPGIWGNLGDASMELGDYDAAREAYLRMFALRPNLASYNRIAWFRFVTGDAQSAIDLMRNAIDSGDPQPENVAWCWAELGDMYFKIGKLSDASGAYRSALAIFPRLHRASAGLGRLEAAQGQLDAAINDYEHAKSNVPLVEYASALADLYRATGTLEKAKTQEELIDAIKKLGAATNERTNRNLALALADHNRDLGVALNLMQAEIPVRGDVYTWDALAWVLYKNGRLTEAKAASEKALKLGTPEPAFYYHGSKIALASGDKDSAEAYRKKLLALNPKFDVAMNDLAKEFEP